ncbi:SDR family NAD(P)-dependent oxidoreductase [Vibrio cholerae]|nr:SDR family NAD(P)-dependent oxidoreductase [Vibrio cholerae]EJL6893549.1 SDR family NAD(P)-dependent oxidoreductase [Vibrio cholerae]ELJ8645860.1 SDR family NAD(P)-dependent oxidoreductase [Vibrio cholerae]EMA9021224.1 SDR family NAD(P)-dependent oxidoreductase [Vibrio cholerae]EMB2630234.1 SDR family NAD(P)-dependent oxidoreductase [Vibrio cholerae]
MRFERKIALVTGAAKGIGESIARHFAAEGAFVYVTDIDQDNGQQVASSLGQAARFALLDVRDEAAWQKLTEEIIDAHG